VAMIKRICWLSSLMEGGASYTVKLWPDGVNFMRYSLFVYEIYDTFYRKIKWL
jgi:hypothetical protein